MLHGSAVPQLKIQICCIIYQNHNRYQISYEINFQKVQSQEFTLQVFYIEDKIESTCTGIKY